MLSTVHSYCHGQSDRTDKKKTTEVTERVKKTTEVTERVKKTTEVTERIEKKTTEVTEGRGRKNGSDWTKKKNNGSEKRIRKTTEVTEQIGKTRRRLLFLCIFPQQPTNSHYRYSYQPLTTLQTSNRKTMQPCLVSSENLCPGYTWKSSACVNLLNFSATLFRREMPKRYEQFLCPTFGRHATC